MAKKPKKLLCGVVISRRAGAQTISNAHHARLFCLSLPKVRKQHYFTAVTAEYEGANGCTSTRTHARNAWHGERSIENNHPHRRVRVLLASPKKQFVAYSSSFTCCLPWQRPPRQSSIPGGLHRGRICGWIQCVCWGGVGGGFR